MTDNVLTAQQGGCAERNVKKYDGCVTVFTESADVVCEIEWIVTRVQFNRYEREDGLRAEQAHCVAWKTNAFTLTTI